MPKSRSIYQWSYGFISVIKSLHYSISYCPNNRYIYKDRVKIIKRLVCIIGNLGFPTVYIRVFSIFF